MSVISVAPPQGQPLPDLWMLENESEQAIAGKAHEAADLLRSFGHRVSVQVCRGHAAHEILQSVQRDRYQLVVMGAGIHSWLGQHLVGSVSNAVLHSSPVSVMIVHRLLDDRPPRKVETLLATDGSEGAKLAATTFSRLADSRRVRVEVLSVAPYLISGLYAVPVGATVAFDEAVQKEALERAEQIATSGVDFLESQGFEATSRALIGAIAPSVLKEADSLQSDLVVVGSRGFGAMGRALLGSTSDNVTRHACATLVVK